MIFSSRQFRRRVKKLIFQALKWRERRFDGVHPEKFVKKPTESADGRGAYLKINRPLIAAATLIVTSVCALSITTTVESNLSFTRQLDRLLALPGSSASEQWENPQHALVQDVREEALVQNFNSSNSAVLRGKIEETPSDALPQLPTETDSSIDEAVEGETSEEVEIETVEEVMETVSPEADSVSDTPLEAMSKGFFKFVTHATKMLPFAQESIIEPIVDEPEETPSETEESEASTPEIEIPFDEPVESETPVENEVEDPTSEAPVITPDAEDILEEEESDNLDAETDGSEEVEDDDVEAEVIPEDPDNWVVFEDFGLPPLNSGQFIRNVQLRVSLGGTLRTSPETLPAIAVEYNTGAGWVNAGTILFDTELSNALNGGYYLFALPTFKNVSDLDNFAVRISYEGDYGALDRLYIDSAWLEIDTETFNREMLNQRINPEMFSGFKLPEMYEYIGTAIDFTREELPQFTLKYESQRNPVVGFFRNLFGRPLVEVKDVTFELPSGLGVPVDPSVELTEDGLLTIQLTDEDKAKLQPGKYEVEITVNEGGKEYTDSFNFQWGVLALNTDQTVYTSGATTTVMLGALSEDGNTLCDARLQLYIFDPEDYIFDAPVIKSGLCNGNNVIDTPDYAATFNPTVPGTYEMYVEHIGQNGEVLAHAYDTFIVEDFAPLTLKRDGPTRINPRFEYPMTLTVVAQEAFKGELVERVPYDFAVMDTGAVITVLEDGTQELRWELDLAAGEEVSFVYNFDAPDISPWLYNLGPAAIEDDTETLVVYESVPNSPYLAQESVIEESVEESPEELAQDEVATPSSEPETPAGSEEVVNEEPAEVSDTDVSETPVEEVPEPVPDLSEVEEDDASTDDEIPEAENPTSTPATANSFTEHRRWQIASDATGSALLYWDSATIPTGWTCVSCAPAGSFYQRFVMGSSTAGTNGGATTHTHTMSSAVTATGATGVSSTGGGGADAAQQGHTHSYTPTIGTGSNLPNYRNLVLIQHNSAGSPASIPTGAIALFDATVPTGWTQYAAQNGAFPRAEATSTVTGTGGSATHTHAITGTTGGPNSTTNAPGFSGSAVATQAHTHTVSGASSAGSSLPPYIGTIFGKLNATSSPTDSMIMMWTDEPPAGWNTVSSTSEPFANRFAVASTTYGVTGGSDTHSHTNFSVVTGAPSASVNRTAAGSADASGAHTHTINFTSVSTSNQLPPYRTAIFAKRAPGGAIPDAPTVHTPFDNERTGTSTITFEFTANDLDGSDTLVYQVEWDDDNDLDSAPLGSRTSDVETGCSPNCFINTVNGGDTNPFNDNERIVFTATSSMTSGATYYYRVRAKETIGNTWSAWSTVRSVTYESGLDISEWYQTQGSQFERGTLSGIGTTTSTAYSNATTTNIPTIAGSNNGNVIGSATLTLTKPSNVEVGDLLIIVVGNDDDTATAQWDNTTFKPSGFTLINEAGNTTSDSHAAAFYRVADGTESNSTSTVAQSADDYWGFYIRVTGASTTNPMGVIGGDYNGGSLTTHNVTGLTTTINNALAFYVLSGDGGDTYPYSVGGSWTEGGEEQAGTGGTNGAGTWGTLPMVTAGATGNAAVTLTSADSASGFQFAINPGSPRGTIMSQEVPFSVAPGQVNWGEIEWNIDEPVGTNARFRVYYSDVAACDTQVPNGALPGNDAGFTASQSPLHIDSLATTTYDALCLHLTFDQGTGTQPPVLNDWTLRFVQTPQFAQQDYRWYANINAITPTDAWPVGGDDLGENASIDADNVVRIGDILRLRMSLAATTTDADADSASFKLQYTATTSCAAVGDSGWYDVGTTGSTTAPWRGYNNASVADAATLPSTVLTNSDHVETYEEQNDSYPNPTAIDDGEIGEWDWVIQHNGATPGATYCFRMARTSGEALKGYNNYPTLITNFAPNASVMYRPFNNEKVASTSPWFEFVSDDSEGEEVDYQIQIDDDSAFGSTFVDTNSIANLSDFTNIVTPADKSPFSSAQRMRYTLPLSLSNGTTYWWRARAIDSAGSGSYGDWSTAQSFTIDTSVTISTWFQTTEAQFNTNLLEGTDATGSNLIQFASGSTTGTTTSSAIDFDDATKGNAWGQFSFTETGSANNILYRLEYFTGSDWALIPDSALAGNAAGYDTSPVDLLNLDSTTYNLIRIRANFNAGSPTLLDWTVRWGERVSVPTHLSPFDNEKFSTTTPSFTFSTTDPQGQDLQYEISWATTPLFTSSTTRNSNVNAGFTNVTSGGDTDPFTSGDTIRYQIQAGDALSANTTYWWRVRAKDPAGSNSFSFWSSPWSFTTATSGESVSVSTWYQTTGAQFLTGSLTNATATAGTVEIGGGIVLQSFNSNTAVPGTSLSLTKPTGVQPGDLLLIIVGNDDNTATAQWNNTTLKPSGFTLINESGSATPDAHAAAFYRVADGTEQTSTSTTAQSSDDYWGYYIRVSGVSTSSPIGVIGTDYNGADAITHNIPGITTTVDQSLAFYVFSSDGGDTNPFSVGGSWTEGGEIEAGTGAGNAAGAWGTRLMATAGATGNAAVTAAGSDGASGFQFSLTPASVTSGTLVSPTVDFDSGDGPAWGSLSWSDTEPGASQLVYRVEYLDTIGVWNLIPDGALSGNSTGFSTSPINLQSLNTNTYNEIRIVAALNCSGANCPVLNDWTIRWSGGFTISGTAYEYDGVASTTSGTVAVAVNGVLQSGKTSTIVNGAWSIPSVTFFDDDVITVFVQGATDANEAVAVTVYDGTPEISGLRLEKRHLTIGSDDNETITNTHLGMYDQTQTEDVFFNVDAGIDLALCATTGCSDAGLRIRSGNTYNPGTGANVTTYDFRNDGTFIPGANIIRVGGAWTNNSTTTMAGSTVIFTATSSALVIDDADSVLDFQNVTFGEGSGAATWTLNDALDVEGALTVSYGTVSRGVQAVSVAGNLTTGAAGYWTGAGTTTFDGIDPSTWTDQNTAKQNIGRVVVNGTTKTTILGSNVLMESMYIGADDTFDLSNTGYTASVRGSWTNTNAFLPRTGTVAFVGTTTSVVANGASNFYNLTFNGAGGVWSFATASLTIENDFTIATGTVTMPTATTTIAGSFLNTGGTFAHNNATVRFTSASSELITLSGTVFTNAFYNALFSGSGSWSFVGPHATTTNAFTITQGTVTLPTSTLAIGGVFAQTGGSFAHNNGTVRFTGSATSTIDVNGSSFNDLYFAGTGPRSFLDASLTVAGDFTIATGTVTMPSGTLSLGGGLVNNASMLHASGTVLFNSTDGGETISLGNSPLHHAIFDAVSGGWTITSNATTTGNVTLTNASTFTLQSGFTLAVAGSFTNSVGGASTTWNGSTLALGAGNYSINTKTNPGDAYGTLRIAANTDIAMWNSTSTTYAVNTTGSLYSQDHNAVDGDLYIWGDYDRTTGSEYWSYATDFDGTSLGGGSRQVDVRFAEGASAGFAGATLQILGTSAATTTVARQAGGAYGIALSNSTLNAEYYNIRHLNSTGIELLSSTTVSSLANGHITVDAVGGSAITVAQSVIDTNTALQIYNVRFETSLGTTSATSTGSGDATFLFFDDFNDASINTGKWTADVTLGTITETGGYLRAGGGITSGNYGHTSLGSEVAYDDFLDNSVVWRGRNSVDGIGELVFRGDYGTNRGYKGRFDARAANGQSFLEQPYSGWTFSGGAGCASDSDSPVANQWYSYEITASSSNFIMYRDGVLKRNCTDTTFALPGEIALQNHYGSYSDYDWVGVRPFVTPAPTSTSWGVEETVRTGLYREQHVVTGSVVGAQTGYVLPIRVNFATGTDSGATMYCNGLCRGDFADVRFANADGSPLSYWREDGYTASTSATFWVKFDSIPASPATTSVYAYYGDVAPRNVTQSGSAPSSYWWFRNSAGDLDGEALDNDTGNPGSIRWDDSQITISVSGTVYSDDGVTPMASPTCNGSSQVVRVVVQGGASFTGSCNAGTGAYTVSGVAFTGDPVLTVYLDTNGGARGVTVTKTPTVNISNLNIHANRVITRHQDTAPLTILDMAVFDTDNDTDIPYTAATGTLTVFANTELHIASSTTFAPGGNVTVQGNASSSSFDGSLHIAPNAHFLGTGTSTYTFGGSFTMDTGANFTAASSTVVMNATTTGKTLTTATSSQEIIFNTLQFTGANGGWNVNGNIRAQNGISAQNGVVSGTGNIRVMSGSFSGNGTVSMGSGTTTIEQSNTLGGTTPWTFGNLVVGNGSVAGTTTSASNATTTILGRFLIATGHTFAAGGSHIDLRGSGTVFVENGVFAEATSTVRYSGTTGSNVLSTTYYDLEVMALGGSPTFVGTGLGIIVSRDLTVGGATTTTLTLDTNDPAFDVNGTVRISTTGTLVGSNSGALTVAGGWDNDGTFTGSGGTVTFDGSGSVGIAAGASAFSNAVVNGAGTFTVSEHATATGAFTLTNAGSFTLQSGQTLAVGGTFTNAVSGGATTWTGSTLALYGGGNYTINASTTSDTYDTMRVDANTQIRMWNSSAGTYTLASTGSLYSQDHASVNGALSIFGTYQKTSGTDYWSYATDFDGTALGGSPRQVTVSIANTGTVRYTGGGLAVVGAAGASTTVQNQGSGTYALEIGGTASTTWSRFVVRNTNAAGLLFGGTPQVSGITFGDFEVAQNGWSAMTVGGTVITQNPAKTFSSFRFATSTGVSSAINVTATGTTVSSWRFTNTTGTIAGEAFDSDPTGDPGYLVWDDSAALVTISGNVYSDEGVTVSTACDNVTPNIHLQVAGLTSYTTSCNSSTGAYSIPSIAFGPTDSIVVYIDGETEKAATVTTDPVSNISNMHLYENRVIVRHENSSPVSIDDMAVWDSTADADIPFTAVDGSPDTLTLPANRKLIVWTGKEFEPNGNVTVSGGGGGAAYDGTVELYAGAAFDATGSESHSIGGSLIMGTSATFDDESSTVTFTTTGAARTIDTNDQDLYNAVFNGSGSWTVTNTVLSIGNDFTVTQGSVTLPSATTTVGGSLSVTGGSFVASGGTMRFTSATGEVIRPRTSSFGTLLVDGAGSFTLTGGFATTTGNLLVQQGTFISATGTFAVGGNFINNSIFSHANGTLRFTSNSSTTVTASSSDLSNVTFVGTGPYTFTNQNLALLGSLRIESGSVALPLGTLSVGGSFLNTGGSFASATGTILFNSSDTGETINPGASPFFNATFASAGGGWTISAHATSTGNFSLVTASNFTLASSTRLSVGGVFTNLVGGGATTWAGSTLDIRSGTGYTINTKTAGGDAYNNLVIGSSTALRAWDSSGTITLTDSVSSFYSQDHAGAAGVLNIYGNYARETGSDYWSYATDFDGASLGGSSRKAQVRIASGATTTFTGGALQMVGVSGNKTEIANQGSGTYALRMLGGTFNAYQYSFTNLDAVGLALQGTTTVSSLSEGSFTLAVNGGALISLASTTLNYNAGLLVMNTSFATTSAITGYNVALTGSTLNAWTFTGHSGNLAGEAFDFDGGDQCGSVRWDNSLCLLTQQSGYRLRADNGGAGVPNSEWLDQNWTKRMRVNVTNQDAVAYSNAVVAVTVPYDSDMQADFDDLRFTAADGLTPLNHFIESYNASDEAVVWVKVPSLATSTYTSVFMYYGNGAAADASATSTFPFIDTFEDGNISEYSGDTSLFTAGTNFGYERSRGLDADGNETQKTTDGIYRTGVTVSQGQTLRYLQYIDTGAGSGDETCTLFGIQSPGSNNQNYAVCLELYGVDRVSISRNVSSNDTSGTILASSTMSYVTGWYEVEIGWRTNNSINVSVSQNGSVVATTSVTDATYTQGGVGFAFWFQNGGWDIYSSRPLLTTEPTITFGAEQVPGGASWLGALNTPAGGVDIGENLRIRFLVENSGLPIADTNYEIEYAAKGAAPSCEAVSAGSYVPVPPQASCGSSPICMQTSTQVTNLAATTDLLGGEGTFVNGQIIEDPSNTTGDLDINTNEYTEVEYVVTPTVNVNDAAYCLRVSDEGDDLDAYTNVAEFGLVFAPIVSALSLNNGSDIVLSAGATTTIYATGTVSDLNGYADLALATTTIFRSGVGEACSANNNNCYIAAPAQCSFTSCSGNSCDVVCSVDMYYHTDPTDIGTYAGETWRALLSISDYSGTVATATAPSIDLLTLRALAVDQSINYGALMPDSNTGTYNATTTLQNIGNDSIDISIEGTDLTDGGSSQIPVTGQRFATSTFNYSACVSCATLSTLGTDFKVDLGKPATTTPAVTDDLFWGIAVPFGVAGTAHYGTNVFYAIGDL